MIRLAMASFWHVHARDYAKQVMEHPDTEVAAVWDEDSERGRAEAERLGVPFYDSLSTLLAKGNIEGVVVDAPTNMHRAILTQIAGAKKHIFTEKVVAASVEDCQAILHAVEANQVVMVVSLPRLYHGYTVTLRQIVAQGLLGELSVVRTRLSHNGATAGWLPDRFFDAQACQGGALIDLGAHPVYLTRLFLGMPRRVSAQFGYMTGKTVEDNAVVTFEHASGALGLAEAGFVTESSPFSVELHGTKGSALYSDRDRQVWLKTTSNRQAQASEWVSVPIAEDEPTAFARFVQRIQSGGQESENLELARDLSRLMEAAYRSANLGQAVALD